MILSIKPEKAGRMESAITSSFFLGALVSLVVITNPLTKIPLFLSLTEGWSSGRRRSEAAHAALDAFFIMVASLVAGNLLLSFFGISYGAMRIAGGFVVAVIGNQMLFGVKTPNDSEHGEKGSDGCAFFPLAMPGIADDCRGNRFLHSDRGGGRSPDESRDVCRGDRGCGAFLLPHLGRHAGSGFLLKGAGSIRYPGPHQDHGFSADFNRNSVCGIRNPHLFSEVRGWRMHVRFRVSKFGLNVEKRCP